MVSHDQHMPDTATQRAALAVARAVLAGDPQAAALATLTASCPVCLTVCTVQLGYALCGMVAGETGFVSEGLRGRLARALESAELELDMAGNLAAPGGRG